MENRSKLHKVLVPSLIVMSMAACSGDDGKDGVNGSDGTNGVNGIDGKDAIAVSVTDVVKTNANIAYAVYSDSLISAIAMKRQLEEFISTPTEENFTRAKQAWLDSREPYGQSEVYRFRSGPIDALKSDGTIGVEGDGPEGRINAWPLGEAIIDYVVPIVDGSSAPESAENALSKNIILDAANTSTAITKAIIRDYVEHGGDGRNVTSGYHAIEFLLWGQDLNSDLSGAGERDATAGHRPVTDFQTTGTGHVGACTSGTQASVDAICTARGQYLIAAAELLIDDLTAVTNAWEPGVGAHYQAFVAGENISLSRILEGMGRLSYGELAGERIDVALDTNSQEDEHSCFSDNTHRDIFLNAKGVQNSFHGAYTRINGEIIDGAGIDDLLATQGFADVENTLRASLENTMALAGVIDVKAKTGKPFDVLIQEGIDQPNIRALITSLTVQTEGIEQAVEALGVTVSDLRQDTEQDF